MDGSFVVSEGARRVIGNIGLLARVLSCVEGSDRTSLKKVRGRRIGRPFRGGKFEVAGPNDWGVIDIGSDSNPMHEEPFPLKRSQQLVR
jgi:hypothetical protein